MNGSFGWLLDVGKPYDNPVANGHGARPTNGISIEFEIRS